MSQKVRLEVPFAIVPEWLLEAEVSANAIRLYAVLHRHADKDEFTAHPSRRRLAEKMRVNSARTVDRALAELRTIGAVEVKRRKDEAGDWTTNEYLLRHSPPGVATPMAPPSATDGTTGGDTGVTTVATRAAHELELLNESPLNEKEQPRFSRQDRNEMKNAIITACSWNPSDLTQSAWNNIEKATSQLLKVGAQPDEVAAFGVISEFEGFGPDAILKHWASFKNGSLIRTGGRRR